MTTEYRNVLITGASSGIGEALAKHYAVHGAQVFGVARRKDRLERLAGDLNGKLEPVPLDVTDTEATVAKIREIDAACGGLDLIIANAGLGADLPVKRFDWAAAKNVLEVNVMGAAATLSAVLPQMCERKRGHLVGISSLAAYRGLPRSAPYSASKAFLTIYCESLRAELRQYGVKVTSIQPGFIKTELTQQMGKLPFLMELDDAVKEITGAITKGSASHDFPWQMATVMRAARAMPNALFDRVTTSGMKRRKSS